MTRKTFILLVFQIISQSLLSNAFSQLSEKVRIDSLLIKLSKQKDDSNKVKTLIELSKAVRSDSADKAIEFANTALQIAEKTDYKEGQALALKWIGMAFYVKGDYYDVVVYWNKSLRMYEETGNKVGESNLISNLGAVYFSLGDSNAVKYYKRSMQLADALHDTTRIITALINLGGFYSGKIETQKASLQYYSNALNVLKSSNSKDSDAIGSIYSNIGEIYLNQNQPDSALPFFQKAVELYASDLVSLSATWNSLGELYFKKSDYNQAIEYHNKAYEIAKKSKDDFDKIESLKGIGKSLAAKGETSKAVKVLKMALANSETTHAFTVSKEIYRLLSDIYTKTDDIKNANAYLELFISCQDSIIETNNERIIQNQALLEKIKLSTKEAEINQLMVDSKLKTEQIETEQKIRYTSFIGLALILIFTLGVLMQRNKIKEEKQRAEDALLELRSTQQQLVKNEKMAAFGTMASRMAHEIQNPLNFVNNFSELSQELVDEIVSSKTEEEKNDAAKILNENLQKINQHGKRASAIISSLQEHSNKGTAHEFFEEK